VTLTISIRRTLNHLQDRTFGDLFREMSSSLDEHGTQRLPHRAPAHRTAGKLAADVFRARCEAGFEEGNVSWEDVLLEEVYEALAEDDLTARRAELIQVMNVCALEIDQIDEELASNTLEAAPVTAGWADAEDIDDRDLD